MLQSFWQILSRQRRRCSMCNEAAEARQSGHNNIDAMADMIEALLVPCDFKGVFIDLVANRGLQINDKTIALMQTIGESKSDPCLIVLQGNNKKAGLIAAYRLATELNSDKDRAKVIEWIRDDLKKTTIDEKSVLLGILHVKGSRQ